MEPLTAKQQAFADEYVKCRNGVAAAIAAGYSPTSAKQIASENLTKPNVRQYIDERLSVVSGLAGVSAAWVRERLRQNVERAMQVEPVLDANGNEIGEYKYSGNVANRALELLGKDVGLFTDRLEVTLGNESRALIEELAKLAVSCCADDKRKQLLDGLANIRSRFAAHGSG